MDVDAIRATAAGQWPRIFSGHLGLPEEILDGKGHPCPKCGGDDRFSRFPDFAQTGGMHCRHCHTDGGDGFAAVMWLEGLEFIPAVRRVADALGITTAAQMEPGDVLDRWCRQKRVQREAIERFGVVWSEDRTRFGVPMYGPDRNPCSGQEFGMGEKLAKGLNAKGKPVGLFWVEPPSGSVLIVEGVKDAAALTGIGYQAIGLPGSKLHSKFAELFRGCNVTIIPDRDIPGERGARDTAATLFGIAETIRIATLPGKVKDTGGDDCRDILAKTAGRELLDSAIESAGEWNGTALVSRPTITTTEKASVKYLDALASGRIGLYSTGLCDLDAAIGGGVAKGEMVVVAARPGHGKSAFALQWLRKQAEQTLPGLIISQEMSAVALGKRELLSLAEHPEHEWRNNLQDVRDTLRKFHAYAKPVYIAEGCREIDTAADVIREHVERKGVQLVAVDYLQLLRGKGGSRYEQVSDVSTTMKQLATELDVIIVTLCQLGRTVERNDGKISMSDMKDSGQIEQDADVILGLAWPWKWDEAEQKDKYRIKILKNRNRESKERVVLRFDPSRQLFRSDDVDFNTPEWTVE